MSSVLPFLGVYTSPSVYVPAFGSRQRDVAVLGSDSMHDASPPQAGSELGRVALHDFALILPGVQLFDNVNLEAVAGAAAQRSRWVFLLTTTPLRFRSTAGSPLNTIKVF